MTPFILAGAMSPATNAGAATQTFAEALAGITFAQLVRPGTPVILGSFASSMSMQTGAPTFGTPEPALILYALAALTRRLGVPFRSGGALTASKIADAQAAYESANSMQPAVLAGVNFVLHTAGWLEGGLTMGYEKFVLDLEQAAMWSTFVRGVDPAPSLQGPERDVLRDADANAIDAAGLTSRSPSLAESPADTSPDAEASVNKVWKRMLSEYEPPAIDEAVDEELCEWIERKKASFPDSDV